jgi:hypothetical protein
METTIVNPRRRLPPRDPRTGMFRRASRRTSRRRNEPSPNENPRRRRRYATRRGYRRNEAITNENPRRRRRTYRRNPDGFSFGRFLAAGLGGIGTRLVMRKLGGIRGADGKMTTTHLLAAAGSIYVAPSVAEWVGANPDEQRAAQDGASAIVASLLVDQHADEFAAAHLLPFKSPAPTGETAGLLGTEQQYAELGQAPASGGTYVTGADGSVWWVPAAGMQGLGAIDAAPRVEIPESAKVGDIIRQRSTGKRYRVGIDPADGMLTLYPLREGTAGELGAGEDEYKRAVM